MSTSNNSEQPDALELLHELSDELIGASHRADAYRAALSAACQLCGADRGTLHEPGSQTVPLGLVAQIGFDQIDPALLQAELLRADSAAHRAPRTGGIVAIEDTERERSPEAQLAARLDYRAVHAVAVSSRSGDLQCVLTLYFREPTRVSPGCSRWVATYATQLLLLRPRHGAAQSIVASEERFRSIFEESNDFIVAADLHQKITYCNPATARALGWATEEVVGRSIAEFIPAPHFDRTSAMLDQKLREGGATRYEVDVFARDGRRMTWEINSRLTFSADGKPTGLHAIGRDVTSMRQAHEELRRSELRLREADQRKDEFLAMLAHELRNPLAPIRTAAHLFRKSGVSGDQLEQASTIIERQVGHITRIVDDLLDVSRLTRGLVTFEMQPTDLKEVIEVAVEQVRSLLNAKQHHLNIALPNEPVILSGEAVRLVQMIANLLNNAARHSGQGLVIDLAVVAHPQLIEIHVRDYGAGIAPELLPRIFDLFAQAERSAARSEGGLGIGLALVRRIAELHGGHVEAHSAGVGRGAHFKVVLPRLASDAHSQVERTGEPKSAAECLRILIVDDNHDAAHMLSMLLELENHATSVAYDGAAGLLRAQAERFDVMVLDIGLPDISGYELARRIRSLPAGSQATLVALTGYGQAADRERSRQAGFDHHLTKPVSAEALQSLLAGVARQ